MKANKLVGILSVMMISQFLSQAEDKELEKRQAKAIEQFVISTRKNDGDFTTISLKNWKNEIGVPFLSFEEMIRKVLNTFREHYKNLELKSYSIIYTNKAGPSGGLEPDFLLIYHETKAKKVYRFGTKEEM